MSESQARITLEEFDALCANSAPFLRQYGFRTEDIGVGTARVRLPYDERHIRPGGTVSGPAMMALADFCMWAAVLGAIGNVPLAVTTSLNINFLRRPQNTDILCHARLLKQGSRLAVGDMWLHADGDGEPCAHATATYSIPPRAEIQNQSTG